MISLRHCRLILRRAFDIYADVALFSHFAHGAIALYAAAITRHALRHVLTMLRACVDDATLLRRPCCFDAALYAAFDAYAPP